MTNFCEKNNKHLTNIYVSYKNHCYVYILAVIVDERLTLLIKTIKSRTHTFHLPFQVPPDDRACNLAKTYPQSFPCSLIKVSQLDAFCLYVIVTVTLKSNLAILKN